MGHQSTLDFVVVGAGKSGTTTLFELMRQHPGIHIPPAKEAPFFNEDRTYERGLAWYVDDHFTGAADDAAWGTVTPQYMIGRGDVTPELIAQRMGRDVPDAKIIALLRDPLQRSFSHYLQARRQGHLNEDFDTATLDLLSRDPASIRDHIDFASQYITASEYGRILESFVREFPRDQILVLFTEELQQDPHQVIQRVFTFLGVDPAFQPEGLHGQHNRGGSRPKIRLLTPGMIYRVPFVEKVWTQYVPRPISKRIGFAINRWNVRHDDVRLDPDSEGARRLGALLMEDRAKLEAIGVTPPWPAY